MTPFWNNNPLRFQASNGAACCAYQTQDDQDPNYIAPCCVSEWQAHKAAPLFVGHLFRGRSPLVSTTYARPH